MDFIDRIAIPSCGNSFECANGDRDAGTRIVPGLKAATNTSSLAVGSCVLWHACCATTTSPLCTCSASFNPATCLACQDLFSAGIRRHETKPMILLGLGPKWLLLADETTSSTSIEHSIFTTLSSFIACSPSKARPINGTGSRDRIWSNAALTPRRPRLAYPSLPS